MDQIYIGVDVAGVAQDVRCDVRQARRWDQAPRRGDHRKRAGRGPKLVPVFEALMQARRDILARIAALDSRIRAIARRHATVRLLMTTPGVGPITAIAVVSAFDDAARFRRSSSAGAYLGLTPRRYESGGDQPERTGVQTGGSFYPEIPLRGGERDLLSEHRRHTAAQLGQSDCRENGAAQGQGRAGAETRCSAP